MDVAYINPFIEGLIEIFKTMVGFTPKRVGLELKEDGKKGHTHGISGVIGLAGEAIGCVLLRMDEQVGMDIVGKFIGEEVTENDPLVADGIGELANMIAGNAKAVLQDNGYRFNISIPTVVCGKNYITRQPKDSPCIVVRFESECGDFELEVSLSKNGNKNK